MIFGPLWFRVQRPLCWPARLRYPCSKSRGVSIFGRAVCLLIDQGTKGTPLRGSLFSSCFSSLSACIGIQLCAHVGGAYALVCIRPLALPAGRASLPFMHGMLALCALPFLSAAPRGRTCPPCADCSGRTRRHFPGPGGNPPTSKAQGYFRLGRRPRARLCLSPPLRLALGPLLEY